MFSMFSGGLPNALHEISLLLTEYITNRGLITLQEFNNKLSNFDYGYTCTEID